MFPTLQRAWLPGACAALLAGGVYVNALHNPFIYDDYHTIVANTSIGSLANLRAIVWHDITRPLVNLSYAVDRAIWGGDPFGFHAGSILLHVLNVLLLFRLAWVSSEDGGLPPAVPAFAAASLFAVHPLMTEAVGYVSGRSEVLVTAWFLGGLICGHRWMRTERPGWAAATVVLWIAACASKETAAVFPFVLFGMDYLTRPTADVRDVVSRFRRLYLPLIAIAVLAGVGRLVILRVEYGGGVALQWRYVLVELDVLRRYISLLIRPQGQTLFHAVPDVSGLFDPRALMGIGVFGVTLALAWSIRRAAGAASAGLVWFLLALAPSSVLAVLDQGEPMAEHRVYLASAGFFLAAGIGIAHLDARLQTYGRRMRSAGGAMMGLVLIALSVQTFVRNEVWSDPVAVWRESVDLAPDHYRPRLLLGEALEDAGRRNEAIQEYETAVRLRPTGADGYMKLGLAQAAAGRIEQARATLRRALALDPHNEPARKALGMLETVSRPS